MITNAKEIQKELNKGMRIISNAIKMAKKNLVIGQVTFETPPRVGRPRKAKEVSQGQKKGDRGIVQRIPDKDLPDLD